MLIESKELQKVINCLAKGARKAKLNDKPLYILAREGERSASFSFLGEELEVEISVDVSEVKKSIYAVTSLIDFEIKVLSLPKDEDIWISLEKGRLFLNWGRSSRITVQLFESEFSVINCPENGKSVTWKEGFINNLARTIPSFTSDGQTICGCPLRGIHISKDKKFTRIQATNRMQAVSIKDKIDWFETSLILPIETILGLSQIISSNEEIKISINKDKTQLYFQAGNIKAVSRLLNGEFPKIDCLCTSLDGSNSVWTFDRLELISAARRIKSLIIATKECNKKMTFSLDGNKVFAELKGIVLQQLGAFVEGSHFSFSVDPEKLESALSIFNSDEIYFIFPKKETAPFTIVGIENDAEDHNYVIMTTKLK